MNKKIISFVTAFFMIFTLFDFPAAVYAVEPTDGFIIDGDTLLSNSTGFAEYANAINSESGLDNNYAAGGNNGISDNKIGENITYTLNDGTLTISGTGEMYNYKSDGWVDDVDSPFYCSEEIRSVIIENGVTNIGKSVFHTCKNLERVEIPESVTAINYRAFANCEKLNSITLPDNLTYIGGWAFEKCGGLTDIIIPDSVVTIDSYAFTQCNGLTKMTVPAGVKLQYEGSNKHGAIFYQCKGLKEVTLYNDRITPSMFYYCDALETVNIEGEVGIINSYAFNGCNRLKKINLPESVYKIDTGAFTGCSSLEEIIIPNNVTVIKQWCFRQCSGLKSIVIPENVSSIERAPFDGCNSLETVFYPYNLDLTNASIPNTSTLLPYKTENDGITITDITLGNGKTEVEIHDTVNGIPVVFVEESVRDKVAQTGHVHKTETAGTCTSKAVCSLCGEYGEPGHSETEIPAVDPTCTLSGATAGVKCSVCGEIMTAPEEIPPLGHSETEIPAVDPTCTLSGATAGVKCSVCGEIMTAPEEIPPLGHSFENGECTVCGAKDPDYSQPTETTPDDTEPPVTNPSDTEPPVTAPPVTDPSDTEPPVTVPPVTAPVVTYPAETAPSNGYPLVIPYGYTASSNEKIFEALAGASDGDTVVVDLNGNTDVDKSVFDEIKGRDVTVRFRLKGGAYWTINGKDIEQSRKVDLGVRMNRMSAPRDEIKELAGDKKTVKFTLSHNGKLGISGILNVPVNEKYNGKYANLYYYSRGFEFVGSSLISDGYAQFRFDHASEYIIVIDDYPHGEDISAAAGAQCDDTPIDGSGHEDSGKAPAYFTDENKIRITNGKRRYRILKVEH